MNNDGGFRPVLNTRMKLIGKEKRPYTRGKTTFMCDCYTVEIEGLAREEIAHWCDERKMDFWCSDQDFLLKQARIWCFSPKQVSRLEQLLFAMNPPPRPAEALMPLSSVDDVLFASVVAPYLNNDRQQL